MTHRHPSDIQADLRGVKQSRAGHWGDKPLMQDENSGKDGRRFNEWLANRPDSRLRAREAAQAIAEGDERCAKGNVPMGLAAAMPVSLVFICVGALALAAYLINN